MSSWCSWYAANSCSGTCGRAISSAWHFRTHVDPHSVAPTLHSLTPSPRPSPSRPDRPRRHNHPQSPALISALTHNRSHSQSPALISALTHNHPHSQLLSLTITFTFTHINHHSQSLSLVFTLTHNMHSNSYPPSQPLSRTTTLTSPWTLFDPLA